MASSGNQHGGGGSGGFDMNKFFKATTSGGGGGGAMNMMQPQPQPPPTSTSSNPPPGNLTTSPSFPLPSSSPSSSSPPYLTPSSSYPPPTGPYHPYPPPHYLSPYPPPPPSHHQYLRPISPNPSPNSAVLMDMLQQQQLPPSPNALVPSAPPVSLASPTASQQQQSPVRMLSSKVPRGRHLTGTNIVYDIDVRMQGEVQPQLEVTPITKYVSDPGLVLGRQIAVNRNYICYGLKPGAIRILNINTALRSLLRGHNQKVTDMAFFAEDVHLLASACVDGRVFIRKINEGPDEEDKPQIFERIVLALKINGEGGPVHPRLCWHPHKQEILIVAIGNKILKIDTTKVGSSEGFSAEQPLNCHIDKLINGVQFVGEHDSEVTELSMCQWMTTRLASASKDGTVKIWEDRRSVPLAVFRPHDGNPVNSVTFLTAPNRPDHIVLITGGPLNQEVKLWSSAREEGWLLPGDDESWQCTQTLTLKSSAESSVEDSFFNQVVALPRAGLFLLANAKKNAIYAVHIEYGPHPAATRMDYLAEFTVTMPILSLTGTSDSLPNGEHIVQVYCVQTQAIQQYALNLSQCLPPPLDNIELEKTESNVARTSEAANSDGSAVVESFHGSKTIEMAVSNVTSTMHMITSSPENNPVSSYPESLSAREVTTSSLGMASSGAETKISAPATHTGAENISAMSPPLPLSPRISRKLSGFQNPSNSGETSRQLSDLGGEQAVLDYLADHRMDGVKENLNDIPASGDSSQKGEKNIAQTDKTILPEPPIVFKHPTHLITPSEILSRPPSSSEIPQISQGINAVESKIQDVAINNEAESVEVEVKVVGETGTYQNSDFDSSGESRLNVAEKKEKFYSQASDLGIQMARDCRIEAYNMGGTRQGNEESVTDFPDRRGSTGENENHDSSKEVTSKGGEPENVTAVPRSPAPATKARKQKGKNSQVPGPSPSPSPFNSTDSSDGPGCSSGAQSSDAALSQLSVMQDAIDQLMNMQKEMQKQMSNIISGPVSKEGKRLEASLGRNIEKIVKANTDALWARFQEENTKHEKLERDRTQQLTNLITNCMNKDLPTALEKTLKKEITAIGPAVARAIAPPLEKAVLTAITESFQKGVGEKAVNQLEKSISSKLEATIVRQIQSQFQTSGKQALQDALRSSMEASVIPAFEMSCKAMFDQVDATFQKGIIKHMSAAQQQFDSAHSSLAISLRDAINSASSITRTLSGELADGQRKLLAMAASGANSNVGSSSAVSNGPLRHEMSEAPLDPKKELSRLITEQKFEEAFTAALHRGDVLIVSWLCSQVDLPGILSAVPLPLSQGVLLALLQQLSCDMGNDTSKKLEWMTEVAAAINPEDPMIAMHVRPIFDQVYQSLGHQRNLPSTSNSEVSMIRLLMHVINSLLMSCK